MDFYRTGYNSTNALDFHPKGGFSGMLSGKRMLRTDSLRGILQSLDLTFETVQPHPSKYFPIYHPLINLSLETKQPSVVKASSIRHT
jgi:hypothetical protein